jgi:alkylation response protein AidB-like acyl-CoA dehydrogenase
LRTAIRRRGARRRRCASAWIGVAATCAVGGGIGAIAGKRTPSERIAFGKPLLVQEAVHAQARRVAARGRCGAPADLARRATRRPRQDASEAAMQARIGAVDAMVLAADEAIQIHGGFGYTVEYHVERHYRDGKTLEVLDGGSDRLRDQLARRQFA